MQYVSFVPTRCPTKEKPGLGGGKKAQVTLRLVLKRKEFTRTRPMAAARPPAGAPPATPSLARWARCRRAAALECPWHAPRLAARRALALLRPTWARASVHLGVDLDSALEAPPTPMATFRGELYAPNAAGCSAVVLARLPECSPAARRRAWWYFMASAALLPEGLDCTQFRVPVSRDGHLVLQNEAGPVVICQNEPSSLVCWSRGRKGELAQRGLRVRYTRI